MKEIKFRMPIFSEDNKFLSFHYWGFDDNMNLENPASCLSVPDKEFRAIQEQYTGLNDNNGKEIFEGDIISVNGKYPKIIEYSSEHFGFVMINISDLKYADWKEIKQRPSQCWFSDYKREIEIIGNIHENKELLKS